MTEKDLLKFHVESLRDYVSFWDFPETRKDTGVTGEEAAYGIFQHAGMLYRYTGDEQSIKGLQDQDISETRRMLLSVCNYISEITLADSVERILSEDALSETQLMQMEDILFSRDTLETVLDLSIRLAKPLLDADDAEVRPALAQARCVSAEIDDVCQGRPDVVSVASRALIGVYDRIKLKEYQDKWWFEEARTLDRTMESQAEEELGITALLNQSLNEDSLFEFPNVADFSSYKASLPEIEQEFAESPLAYAAAGLTESGSEVSQFPADGEPIVTAYLDGDSGNCVLNLGTEDPLVKESLVWIGIPDRDAASQPGYFVIPHSDPRHIGSYVARTTVKLKRLRGADLTPVQPKVFPWKELFASSIEDEQLHLLVASALHALDTDPPARQGWLLFFQKLQMTAQRNQDDSALKEVIQKLKEHKTH